MGICLRGISVKAVWLSIALLLLPEAFPPVEAATVSAKGICGNGIIEDREECDDGNLLDGDGCNSACRIEQACYDIGYTFSFFTWGDTYPGGGEEGLTRMLTDAVNFKKYPRRIIPRFWIGVGDMPFMTEGITVLDELNNAISDSATGENYPFACKSSNGKFPYFIALGNHDVDPEPEMTPEAKYQYWSNTVGPNLPITLVGIRNFKWGPSHTHDVRTTYSFDYQNAHFVIINQYHDDPTFPSDDPVGCIRDGLYNWVNDDLAATDKPIRFVFGHEPAWSYCSDLAEYGGDACPKGSVDNQNPPFRLRPYSSAGNWGEAFGRHWGDSLEDTRCPDGSRDRFWRMLAAHNVMAHFVGHTHTYGSRLVEGDGTRRNEVSPYNKGSARFGSNEGVWEINTGFIHHFAGCAYVLTTIQDDTVTFEAYDQVGPLEPFKMVETWTVTLGSVPRQLIMLSDIPPSSTMNLNNLQRGY